MSAIEYYKEYNDIRLHLSKNVDIKDFRQIEEELQNCLRFLEGDLNNKGKNIVIRTWIKTKRFENIMHDFKFYCKKNSCIGLSLMLYILIIQVWIAPFKGIPKYMLENKSNNIIRKLKTYSSNFSIRWIKKI